MFACSPPHLQMSALIGLLAVCALGGCASGGAAPPPPPSVAELARLPDGATLIGLRSGDLEGVMGQPALVRQEGAAQYWRYGLAGCQLDLFLYADPRTGAAHVTYLDVRPAIELPPATSERCAYIASRLRANPAEPDPLPGRSISQPL